jgi:phospho-N-acetylmuramoyl-pentapeptide-transferase
MGGLLFLAAPLVALIVQHDLPSLALAVVMIGCGLVGMVDDVAAIRKKRNQGLKPRAKFLATVAVGVAFLAIGLWGGALDLTSFHIPSLVMPSGVILVLALCAILGTTHGVNLTDGLDGLAGGTALPAFAVAAWLALSAGKFSLALFDAAVIGAVLGFLVYNRHPARVFMGDTGALALGGALAGSMVLSGTTLLLPLVGGVFVAEALSVILQVTSFKTTGKRIFRMSPLHHHFELGGVSEVRVTQGFWLASAACAAATVALAH